MFMIWQRRQMFLVSESHTCVCGHPSIQHRGRGFHVGSELDEVGRVDAEA